LQLSVTEPSATGQGFAEVIRNAAGARIEGAEVEVLGRPLEALTLKVNAGYLDAHYTSFYGDLVGNGVITNNNGLRLPYAPKYSGSAGADYVTPLSRFGSFTLGGTVNYVGAHTTSPADLPVEDQNGYAVVDIQAMYKSQDQRYEVTGYVKNPVNRITSGKRIYDSHTGRLEMCAVAGNHCQVVN
jgi:outer membrane receptor for ferric coprogen and ferric-rhodotorulic acid